MNTRSFLLAAGFGLAMTVVFSCSSDDSGSGNGNSETPVSSSSGSSLSVSSSSKAVEPWDGNPVTKAKITGISQKGPFVKGSAAVLHELDDKFAQTGRSFRDIIVDDYGKFEIKNIELVSPYAMLEATGFYRNEVTGAKSSAPITLYAIADVREKDNININILTHLEYYRVLNLIEDGKTLAEAKKQAQKEILAVFGIDGDSFKDSEDMSIFGASESDAALLAISVLLQSNLKEADFSERLTDFRLDIQTAGKWDNEEAKDAIADWAYSMSMGNLDGIKNNILAWDLSEEVPSFEKYVSNYWATNAKYGLGKCNSSNEGEIKGYGLYYACENNFWRKATKDEFLTYNLGTCNSSNEIKQLDADVYKCESGAWKTASYIDFVNYHLGGSSYISSYIESFCSEKKICSTIADNRDGKTYKTVQIGSQRWMAENLNYEAAGMCDASYCDIFGRLYDWETAMSACPEGWHLPSQAEWDALSSYVESDKNCSGCDAMHLKAASGWYSGNGQDSYGFAALPGGNGVWRNFSGAGG